MSDWTVEDARQAAARELRRYADTLCPPGPPETVESLREAVDAEHAAWLSAENAVAEANAELVKVRAERDGARVSAGRYLAALQELGTEAETVESLHEELAAEREGARARWRVRLRLAERDKAEAERDEANAELARFQAWHAETVAAWDRQREHWLGGDHSNQTPYPVVRE